MSAIDHDAALAALETLCRNYATRHSPGAHRTWATHADSAAAARQELARLREACASICCCFCGTVMAKPPTPEEGCHVMAEHVLGCDKHPLRAATLRVMELEAENAELQRELFRTVAEEGGSGDA